MSCLNVNPESNIIIAKAHPQLCISSIFSQLSVIKYKCFSAFATNGPGIWVVAPVARFQKTTHFSSKIHENSHKIYLRMLRYGGILDQDVIHYDTWGVFLIKTLSTLTHGGGILDQDVYIYMGGGGVAALPPTPYSGGGFSWSRRYPLWHMGGGGVCLIKTSSTTGGGGAVVT